MRFLNTTVGYCPIFGPHKYKFWRFYACRCDSKAYCCLFCTLMTCLKGDQWEMMPMPIFFYLPIPEPPKSFQHNSQHFCLIESCRGNALLCITINPFCFCHHFRWCVLWNIITVHVFLQAVDRSKGPSRRYVVCWPGGLFAPGVPAPVSGGSGKKFRRENRQQSRSLTLSWG